MNAFFYPSVNGDRVYDATAFEHWLKKFFTTGVFLNDLQVTANNDMTVNVGTGYSNVDGKVKIFEADTTLQIETAGATYPRIDSVVLERNDTERDVFLKVIKGGYSSEPVAHVPVRQDGVYQLVIAQILVNAGAVKISQLDITDTRSDMELCGIVAGAVDQIDFSQLKAQFDAYVEKYKDEIAEYEEQMQADFEAWFENIRNQLDEDAAGHLQNQIDGINEQLENVGGSRVEVTVDDADGEYNVVGLTVNLEIDGQTYTKKVPAEKVVVFQVLEIGKAYISCIDESQGYTATTSIEIPCYSAFEAELSSSGLNSWLSSAGYTTEQYPTVADVLADEKAVRKLMTVHASCDAFVDWYNADNSMLAEFTQNRVAMKWIGLRDYIADKLMAIPSVLEQLLASEHWEYILKDKVPKMTSDTAPEGSAIANSVNSGFNAWKAFDGDESTYWQSSALGSDRIGGIGYKFNAPIVVRKVSFVVGVNNEYIEVLGSNDETNWDVLAKTDAAASSSNQEIYLDNNKAYIAYKVNIKTTYQYNGSYYASMKSLQFFGRSLNESVPIMTSNTAPLGEAFALTEFNATYAAFTAFDNNSETRWVVNNDGFTTAAGQYVGYKFVKPIRAKRMLVTPMANTSGQQLKSFVVKARNSDAEEWVNVSGEITLNNSTTPTEYNVELTSEKAYKHYALYATSNSHNTTSSKTIGIVALNFYGVSYSEEEFGSDDIEMLYDNGVELVDFELHKESNGNPTKHNDYVTNTTSTSTNSSGGITTQVNFNNHKHLVANYDGKVSNGVGLIVEAGAAISRLNIETNKTIIDETNTSGELALDVSNVSGSNNAVFRIYAGSAANAFYGKELAKMRKFYLIK